MTTTALQNVHETRRLRAGTQRLSLADLAEIFGQPLPSEPPQPASDSSRSRATTKLELPNGVWYTEAEAEQRRG